LLKPQSSAGDEAGDETTLPRPDAMAAPVFARLPRMCGRDVPCVCVGAYIIGGLETCGEQELSCMDHGGPAGVTTNAAMTGVTAGVKTELFCESSTIQA